MLVKRDCDACRRRWSRGPSYSWAPSQMVTAFQNLLIVRHLSRGITKQNVSEANPLVADFPTIKQEICTMTLSAFVHSCVVSDPDAALIGCMIWYEDPRIYCSTHYGFDSEDIGLYQILRRCSLHMQHWVSRGLDTLSAEINLLAQAVLYGTGTKIVLQNQVLMPPSMR